MRWPDRVKPPDFIGGPVRLIAQVTGIEAATRAMERFAASADRAARILDQLDATRLERLLHSADRAADILDRIDAERIDRLAASAERAAAMLDRLDERIGVERAVAVLERLERLSETTDQMNRSLRAIETLTIEIRKRILEPLDRLSLPRLLRGVGSVATQTRPPEPAANVRTASRRQGR